MYKETKQLVPLVRINGDHAIVKWQFILYALKLMPGFKRTDNIASP